MTSILDTLLAHLDACNTAQVEAAAQASGVPYHTVAKIKRRETLNPRIKTVQRLLIALAKEKIADASPELAEKASRKVAP